MKTPCMTYSESGQPTGGGPCAEFVALKKERDAAVKETEDIRVICHETLDFQSRGVRKLRQENNRLRATLCLYQLQHWTMKYRLERWFDLLVGDNSEGCSG